MSTPVIIIIGGPRPGGRSVEVPDEAQTSEFASYDEAIEFLQELRDTAQDGTDDAGNEE